MGEGRGERGAGGNTFCAGAKDMFASPHMFSHIHIRGGPAGGSQQLHMHLYGTPTTTSNANANAQPAEHLTLHASLNLFTGASIAETPQTVRLLCCG
eukprot:scaffold13021_cov127-Isochrysis_galbana.AAC.12